MLYPTAIVMGSLKVPVPPALWCNTGYAMAAEPAGVLSQRLYEVVYAWMNISPGAGGGDGGGGGGGDIETTVTLVVAEAVPALFVAVRVYTTVFAGETVLDVLNTVPTP